MAIYHFSAKVISRASGRSAIAAAAYRSASQLYDERLGRAQDYSVKPGVVHSEILLPVGAPARWLDRSVLWNEVEAGEKRQDAQLAKEFEIALPQELGQAEAIRLARDFVHEQFVARGMVADLNVHWGKTADGEAQPHAHVMLTMRRVEPLALAPDGVGFGLKERAWNDRALLPAWRARWAELANKRLAELGHDVRIDHRSYREQGIALEPQNKIGPAGMRRESRAQAAERAAEHRAIAARNGLAIAEKPEIALTALTHQQSSFTRRDLARFVDRHTDGADQFRDVMAKVEASLELVRLGMDGRGRERLTSREMLTVERRMEQAADALGNRRTHAVSLERRRAALDGTELGREQALAFGHVTRARDLTLVVGYAGSGKSTMLGVARRAWAAEGYRVRGAALSGVAAEGLEAGSGIESRTIASLEYAWAQGKETLSARDVLVVDEAGMVGSRQMERVLSRARAAGAKVVLVGDPEQLQAIEAGAAFRALAERHGAAEITEVRRQRDEWQRQATRELATGHTAEALGRYTASGMVREADTREDARAALVAGWDDARKTAPEESRIILAYTRDDVRTLNRLARERMRESGALHGADQAVQTERGERAFAAGDRIMFLRNERALDSGGSSDRDGVAVKNGTLGTVLAVGADGEKLTVRLDGLGGAAQGRAVTFSVGDYAHIDHGYAATVHKAQGVTVDRTHVLATPFMDRHAAYVALTRHRGGVSLHYAREDFADRARLAQVLGRERAKDTSLDYGAGEPELARSYAARRGLAPESEIVVRPGMPELAPKSPAATRVTAVEQAQAIAAGKTKFRERYAAHQQQAMERDERAARDLVATWDRLAGRFEAVLPKLDADPTFGGARDALLRFGRGFKDQPAAVALLRERGEAFGMTTRPGLQRVLAAAQPEQLIAASITGAEADMRAELKQRAELEAKRQQELEAKQRQALRRGPSLEW
ncbi:MAG: Ti-type conjugative transfer relaxase TraA [Acetobacteraceae bacterium]|nr:Ti-type conjugative transfer relaxase TraA [Acetobacteraceae bacterium]